VWLRVDRFDPDSQIQADVTERIPVEPRARALSPSGSDGPAGDLELRVAA
jgi:hypothetical protein